MDYFTLGLIALVLAVIVFLILNYYIKRFKKPADAEEGIWNAVYFIQLKQYQKALDLLDFTEKEYAMTPEVMCDLCIQRAEAHRHLEQYREATDAYEVLYEALKECETSLKRNDALLQELKDCYLKCDRSDDFRKWEQLFNEPTEDR